MANSAKKSKKELSEDMTMAYRKFIENGGKIEKIPYNSSKEDVGSRQTIRNLNPKVPELLTLHEGANLFGQKSNRKKKIKVVDLSRIDKNLIPASLHGLFNVPSNDTEKNKESHEADTN